MMHKKKKDTLTVVMVTVIGILLFLILVAAVLLFVRPMIHDGLHGRVVEKKLTLGKRYLSEMEYENAVTVLLDVVRIDKKNTEAYVGLGDAYSGLGEWEEAAESYDEAVRTVVDRVLDGNTESGEMADTLVREEVMRKADLDDSRQEYIREKELAAINVSVDKTDGTEIVDSVTETSVNYADPTPKMIIQLVEKRNSATEKVIEEIEKNGGSLSPYQEYIDWSEQHPRRGDHEIGDDSGSPYVEVIENLIDEYGTLRIAETDDDWDEADGLCYLQLIDFTKDGVDELFAVCKNEGDDHYTGYIYTLMNNEAKEIYRNDAIEYNLYGASDIVYMGYLDDTGYIFGTGEVDEFTWDMTYFWYQDEEFKPVYHQKGHLRGDEGEEVIEEESIKIDILDDEHNERFWDSASEITLRYENTLGRDFSVINELQNAIDNTIRKMAVDPGSLPLSISLPEKRIEEISIPAIYNCIEKNLDQWTPDSDDHETFWDLACFYCNFTDWINTQEYPRMGENGYYNLIPSDLLKNAGFALYPDFDGTLPPIDEGIWRAQQSDLDTVGITIGDSSVITLEIRNSKGNDDGSVDIEYDVYYNSENSYAGDFIVHYAPNPNYARIDGYATYFYTISGVERKDGESSAADAPASDDSWKNAYAEYLESDPELDEDYSYNASKCGFIYLDADDIPEMFIHYGIEASGTRILSYKNGEVVDFLFSRLYGIQYLEREGLVYNVVGHMGVAADTIVYLDDDGFHSLGSGSRFAGEEISDYIRFEWEGEEVSEEKYMNEIKSLFDVDRAKTWTDYEGEIIYSRDEMCDYLRS